MAVGVAGTIPSDIPLLQALDPNDPRLVSLLERLDARGIRHKRAGNVFLIIAMLAAFGALYSLFFTGHTILEDLNPEALNKIMVDRDQISLNQNDEELKKLQAELATTSAIPSFFTRMRRFG